MPSGALIGNGQSAVVKMTTNGGQPAIGAPVWVASNEEDGATWQNAPAPQANAARGKLTATKPTLVMPTYPAMRQNLIAAGAVTDNTNYSIDKTVTITVSTQTACQYVDNAGHSTVSPDTTQTFRGTRCNIGTDYFTTPGTTPHININNNETLVITFIVDDQLNIADSDIAGWRNRDVGNLGWQIDVFTSCRFGEFVARDNGGAHVLNVFPLAPGKNVAVVSRHDGLFHVEFNGGTINTVTDAQGGVGAQTFTMDFAFGLTTAIVKLGRALNDTEMFNVSSAGTGTDFAYYTEGLDPYRPDPTLLADSSLQWYVDFSSYTGGTLHAIAGPVGTAFDFTTVGTPVVRTMGYTWLHSPAAYFQDGSAAVYDSRHSVRPSPFSRMRISVQHQYEYAMASFGMVAEDVDNNDEGDVTMFASGQAANWYPVASVGVASDGTLIYKNATWREALVGMQRWQSAGAGPYSVDFVVQDQFLREDTFASTNMFNVIGLVTSVTETGLGTRATSTIEADFSTSRRLLMVGDGLTFGGHQMNLLSGAPLSGAPCSRVRATYPGKVTGEIYAQGTLEHFEAFGGFGTMETYARRLVSLANQGSPATRQMVIELGYSDYQQQRATGNAALTAARLRSLLDWIHTLDPVIQVFWAPPFTTPTLAVVNANGETLQQFIDAQTSALAGRPWITRVTLSSPNAIAWLSLNPVAFAPDIGAGQQAVADNIKSALGY